MNRCRNHFIFGTPVAAAVISCISCHWETDKTPIAACCVPTWSSLKRLHKIGGWSHIRKRCIHVEDAVMNTCIPWKCLCLLTSAWKWKWHRWINHDLAHIKEMFPPNTKVANEKKYPKYYAVPLLFQSIFAFPMNALVKCPRHTLLFLLEIHERNFAPSSHFSMYIRSFFKYEQDLTAFAKRRGIISHEDIQ